MTTTKKKLRGTSKYAFLLKGQLCMIDGEKYIYSHDGYSRRSVVLVAINRRREVHTFFNPVVDALKTKPELRKTQSVWVDDALRAT